MVPLRHVGNIPHRVMAFEIATAEARWTAAGHPLLKFFRQTHHPDIDIGLVMPQRGLRTTQSAVRAPAPMHMPQFAAA
jgi:hypothetical protein